MKLLSSIALVLVLFGIFSGCDDDDGGGTQVSHTVLSLVPNAWVKGTFVEIQGSGFVEDTAAIQVFFNDRLATVVSATKTEIGVLAPAGAGPGFVTVKQ